MHTCVSYIKWLKTPLKSLNSDSNRSHGDLPSRQITMYFFILLKHEITFPTLLTGISAGRNRKYRRVFLPQNLGFLLLLFFWFLVLDFTMFYICCNEKKNRCTLSFWRPYVKLSAASLVIITWHISRSLFIHRSSNLLKRM